MEDGCLCVQVNRVPVSLRFSTVAMAAQASVQHVSLDNRRLTLRNVSTVRIRRLAVRHAATSDDTYVAATKLRQLSDLPGTSCNHATESVPSSYNLPLL
jgi:hypothetical protein